MAVKRLTDAALRHLKPTPDGKRGELADTEVKGLHAVANPPNADGKFTISLVMVLRYGGAKHPSRRRLGQYPTMSLKDARAKARRWRAMVEEGIDPKAELKKRLEAEAAKKASTVAVVAEDYIKLAVRQLRSSYQIEADLRREVIGKDKRPARWPGRSITSITDVDVGDLIEEIAKRAPYQARNVFSALRAMFNWAIARKKYNVTINPCDTVNLDDRVGSKRKPRKRVLDEPELRAFWRATGKLNYPWGPYLRLLLLTGARRSEIAGAMWGELGEDHTLRIPPERTKTDEWHIIPLSSTAAEIVNSLPHVGESRFLFTIDGAAPIVGHSDAKRRVDQAMANELHCHADDFARGGARAFVVHDLRRTVRTRLAKLKVDFITSELILGHAVSGISAVYDVHKYEDEKRAALQAWADHLQGIVGNGVQGNLFNNGNAEARL
jgi:integrase